MESIERQAVVRPHRGIFEDDEFMGHLRMTPCDAAGAPLESPERPAISAVDRGQLGAPVAERGGHALELIGVGLLLLLGGVLFTLVSYSMAAPGGRFLVATGAMVAGLLAILRGLFGLMMSWVAG
jgi:hypothetical protein